MKTTIKKQSKFINLLALIFLVTTFSCSSDDDGAVVQISAPTIELSNTNLITNFFTEGETDIPIVNWNGNTGIFSLASNISGVSVDVNTGMVSWSKSLSLDLNSIELIATNSAGQASINITIDNQFSGNFDGAFNSDPTSIVTTIPFEMNFNSDGTMVAIGTSEAPGIWTMSGNTITTNYVTSGGNDITAVLDLTYSDIDATLTGFFSTGITLSNPPTGYMALAIE